MGRDDDAEAGHTALSVDVLREAGPASVGATSAGPSDRTPGVRPARSGP
ncbi:hypothetical protein STVIR_5324 [Streptomyces viridochromogenes Tue57]|uniref:Uncharacterized protein n=1 Tax=Streptomyces viridochromogenes Tue57 TaxID=1160705 RepID=L8PEH3_STRVR|nr:hypothetical protein STVIR_5324 [Streptomyces viridochromogenes Tue57]